MTNFWQLSAMPIFKIRWNFVSIPWNLDNPNYHYSHTEQCNQFNRSISGLVCLTVRNFSLYFQFWTNYKVKHIYRSTDLAIGKIGDAKKYRWREIWPRAKNLDLKHHKYLHQKCLRQQAQCYVQWLYKALLCITLRREW